MSRGPDKDSDVMHNKIKLARQRQLLFWSHERLLLFWVPVVRLPAHDTRRPDVVQTEPAAAQHGLDNMGQRVQCSLLETKTMWQKHYKPAETWVSHEFRLLKSGQAAFNTSGPMNFLNH